MPDKKSLPKAFVSGFNAKVVALRSSPRWGRAVRKRLTVVSYTGRRSGKVFSIPVAFKRDGDTILIRVAMPERKKWWRNFLDEGGTLSLEVDDTVRTGHAVSRKDDKGRVTVTVRLAA